MKFNKAVTATIFLIAIIGLVSASPAEMTLFPEESSTRINSFTSYEVTVENAGPVKDIYRMSSSNPTEITIAPTEVELEPGQEETVNVWYNPETDREEGRYSFTVTGTSRATGNQFPVEGHVNVIREHDILIEVDDASQTGCLGEEVTYEVELTNRGSQAEEFRLSTNYGELSAEEVTLAQGETQEVGLAVSADSPVQRSFNIVAASPTSYAQDIQELEFSSEICYASEVSITPQSLDVPARTEAEYEVTVSNTGTRDDEYELSANRGVLDDDDLNVDAGEEESTTLTYTPQELGQKTIRVTATSEDSDIENTATATANAINTMDMEVSFDQKRRAVCEDSSVTYTASVVNTGDAEETYNLRSNIGNLSVTEGTLDPGDTGTVNLTVDGTQYEPGQTLNVSLTVTASTFGEPVKTRVAKLDTQNCWDLDMNVVPKIQSAGENRSVIYEIRLSNTGARQNTYQLDWEGPDWIDIKPREVTVASGERETSYMYAGIPFKKQGQVRINVTGEGRDVERSQTVRLLINETIEEAIQDEQPRGPTGAFSRVLSSLSEQIASTTTATRVLISLLMGAVITAVILFQEW